MIGILQKTTAAKGPRTEPSGMRNSQEREKTVALDK
jgi:hypothetical protein